MTAEGSRVCHRCSASHGGFLFDGRRSIKTMDSRRKKITTVASGVDLPDILRGATAEKIEKGGRTAPNIAQDQWQNTMRVVASEAVLNLSSTRSG